MPKPLRHCLFFLLSGWLLAFSATAQPDFRAIDRHAMRAPEELHQDLPRLTAYLTGPADSETEKVRSIYTWIIHHLQYDDEVKQNGSKRINKHIADILRRRKAVCFGYATLFQAMCEQAGLNARIISGYSKGTLTATPNLDKPDHAWNAIQIDGQWYLLDVTWGSSRLYPEDPFLLTNKEEYFLSIPSDFVLTHLPTAPMWQLLDCPVSPSLFQQPPDSIQAFLATTEPCFAYEDSLAMFLALPLPDQHLREAEIAYGFIPSTANRKEWAHQLIRYAGHLADQAEALQDPKTLDSLVQLQNQILTLCEKAHTLDELYDWQVQLHVNTLINQAVALYQLADKKEDPKAFYRQALQHLEKGEALLSGLPDSILLEPSRQQCAQYKQVIEETLENE